jgi:hypothetical protein
MHACTYAHICVRTYTLVHTYTYEHTLEQVNIMNGRYVFVCVCVCVGLWYGWMTVPWCV